MDIGKAVEEVKAGKIDFKVDKYGIVHAGIGKVSFEGAKIRENAIAHFERWIDWENSARRDHYKALHGRLYTEAGPDKFELPARAVTEKLIHALESQRPRARYYVTTPTYVAGLGRRLLPTRWLDRFTGGR